MPFRYYKRTWDEPRGDAFDDGVRQSGTSKSPMTVRRSARSKPTTAVRFRVDRHPIDGGDESAGSNAAVRDIGGCEISLDEHGK